MVFCDISKAFDRVWHKGLYIKLKSYGFDGPFLSWLSDYISNISQRVTIKNSHSHYCSLKSGVPQGYVLGPLLFLIYINDIADNLNSLSRLFADDTSLLITSPSMIQIEEKLNEDLDKLNEWSKIWLTNFNPDKTQVLLIKGYRSIENNPNLSFNNKSLECF